MANLQVRFSPFDQSVVAVAQAANFGIIGSGAVSINRVDPSQNKIVEALTIPTADTCFDICFNEGNP